MQMRPLRNAQLRTEPERARAGHAFHFQIETPLGLHRLRLAEHRVILQRAVHDFAMRADIVSRRPHVRPIHVMARHDAFHSQPRVNGLLVGVDDVGSLVFRIQKIQNIATEYMNARERVAIMTGAAEFHDTAAQIQRHRPRPLAGDNQSRHIRMARQMLFNQPPQVIIDDDIDIMNENVIRLRNQFDAFPQATALVQQFALHGHTDVPSVFLLQTARRLIDAIALIARVDDDFLHADFGQHRTRQFQKRHAAKRNQRFRTAQRRRTQTAAFPSRQYKTANVTHAFSSNLFVDFSPSTFYFHAIRHASRRAA